MLLAAVENMLYFEILFNFSNYNNKEFSLFVTYQMVIIFPREILLPDSLFLIFSFQINMSFQCFEKLGLQHLQFEYIFVGIKRIVIVAIVTIY